MKTNKIKYPMMALAAALTLGACSPEETTLSQRDLTADELVQGIAYSVSVDAQNTVTLTSLLDKSYNCFWTHPNGRAQGRTVTTQLPFSGTYEVSFGVDTRGGVVYGNPYQFQVTTNNMSLLEDPLYTYLTGGVGSQKKWVPNDKAYGVGQCSGPVMYCNPDDVLNDGSGDTNIGINHMTPNWDPGYQSWLIPQDSPYMNSYMIFSLDDVNGCTITEYRGDDGTTQSGKWNLNVSDKNHPTLSFTDAFVMHNTGFDAVCDNYTTDIVITELTPYFLQFATMRTNSEGAWWIVWNFIAADVQDGTVEIPSDEPSYIEPSAPVLPEIDGLTAKLFTTDINGVEFTGAEMTYQVNADAPYDWMWWNGGSSSWETVVNEEYGTSWAPKADEDAVAEVELTLTQKGTYAIGEQEGTYTIDTENSKLVFDQEITLFTVDGDQRTVALKGREWQVFKVDPGSEVIIGVPASQDADGNTNSYLIANLTYKEIGGGQTGPVNVAFNNDNRNNYIEAGNYFRCQLYNPWGGDTHAVDPANIKLKKNQKLNVTLKLSGFTFSQTAKMVLCLNWEGTPDHAWEPDCFGYSRAIDVNSDGTYTISWTNDTGSTVNWATSGQSALTMTMQYVGYATLADESEDGLKAACEIVSITIE